MNTIISNPLRLSILLCSLIGCLAGQARAGANVNVNDLPPVPYCQQDMFAVRGEGISNVAPRKYN